MRGEDVQANALFWEEEAEKLIQEDTKTNQKCFFGFCPHCIWRYRRGKELTNKKEQIKRLIETGEKLSIGFTARLPDVECYSPGQYIPFEISPSKYKELLDALKDDNNFITGMQGMGGTGKTTLVKEVCMKLKQSKQFTQIIHTTVSFSPDIKKIQDDIARPLGLKFDDCNESDRHKILWSRLTNGEKILLILDDVWEDIDFDEIGIPYSDNHKGCRILVTTRNILVCYRLGCSKTIQLDLLSKEDAWIMFQRHAGLSKTSNESLFEIGREIANECKRLPVAIAVIASNLEGKQHHKEWNEALNSMRSADDEILKFYKCIQFTYENMKNDNAKKLFLLCSVFREDDKISTEMLTRFGIGGGLFGEDYGSYKDARSQVVISKQVLRDSCLLLEENQNKVKMYDLIRDAALQIANREIQTVKLDGKNQKAIVEREKNIKYLFCEGRPKDVFSCKLDGSKLVILIVTVYKDEECHNVKIEVPNSFFETNNGLRVFHFLYDNDHKIPLSLPRSIESLKNIRSLLFTLVDLGDISTLGNLQSLETLDLKDCKIDELPLGIADLEKFRLLNLESCEIVRNNPFEVIERCSSLEELYFTGSFNTFCREITFPKLQSLQRFCIDEYSRPVNDSSSKYVSVVDNDEVFLSEATLKYCMQTTEVLRLRRIETGWRNLIPQIVSMDQGMKDIVELSLSCISQLRYLVDTKDIVFQGPNVVSKLVVLKLDRMENLEELFNGPVSFDFLKNLQKISIKDCKHLQSLFKFEQNLCNLKTIELQNCPMLVSLFRRLTSRNLVLLEELQIADCEGLENIITDERRDEESREEIHVDDDDHDSRASMFPKLKVLDIEGSSPLKYILPFLYTQSLPVLEAIRIRRCEELKYIFGHDYSMLSYRLCIWERVQCLPIQSYRMCNIKEIVLCHILKIKSVFILSITPKMLLETLTIKNCDELKNIILDTVDEITGGNNWGDVFPKLKSISVEDCMQLEYIIFGHDNHDHQSPSEINLRLPALKYINLCNLPGLVAMCTRQHRTTFPPLVELECNGCSHVAIKSFRDFGIHPISKSQDDAIMKEDGDGQRAIAFPPIAITKPVKHRQETSKTNSNNAQVFLNDDAIMKVSSDIEDQFLKDDEILVSKSKLCTIVSQCPSKPAQGDPSQRDEDLSYSWVVTKELRNLVSENYLAIENLSLLTDFLVKNPSVLRDTSLSNRFKGYAYNCLAELLKFLQKHYLLDVLGSSHSEFVELLQDMRRFPFDKEWLDGVEKLALFPGLQVSQNALQNFLDSKHILTQHVEDLKHQLASFEAVLQNITQQEAQILETQAALSDPIGY
ncbi:putative P-loop containing nucleoside triphosphate hydrolase, leucine-rich repeat domain, L [Medicago truncatula]|nr:putative P-loop containing nucleoside triphosphate hydrolase, leucine-rich repeat domain, L [Medicago truncatula]